MVKLPDFLTLKQDLSLLVVMVLMDVPYILAQHNPEENSLTI